MQPAGFPEGKRDIYFETDSCWEVVDVWDSEEAFDELGEVLGPVLQKLGLDAQPKIHPRHNSM